MAFHILDLIFLLTVDICVVDHVVNFAMSMFLSTCFIFISRILYHFVPVQYSSLLSHGSFSAIHADARSGKFKPPFSYVSLDSSLSIFGVPPQMKSYSLVSIFFISLSGRFGRTAAICVSLLRNSPFTILFLALMDKNFVLQVLISSNISFSLLS